jgi:hypothetical protein
MGENATAKLILCRELAQCIALATGSCGGIMLNLKEFAVPFGLLCLALWVWLFAARLALLILAFFVTALAVIAFYIDLAKSEEARLGLIEGGIPIGAALFDAEGKLLGRGRNRRVQESDPSTHAETDAFRKAGRQRSYTDKIMVMSRPTRFGTLDK